MQFSNFSNKGITASIHRRRQEPKTSGAPAMKAKLSPVAIKLGGIALFLCMTCISIVALGDTPGSINSNFNGTAIASGDYVWFISVLKPPTVGSQAVTLFVRNSTIQFTANGTNYTVPVPNADITFDPNATTATTSFNASDNAWHTTLPASGLAGNALMDAVEFPVPAGGLPGGIQNVKWLANFSTDTAGVSVQWMWSAAVYTSFNSDYNTLGVKPVDDNKASQYQNSDHAGTPENFKADLTAGATGGGGSNYTGGLSGTASVAVPVNQFPTASAGGPYSAIVGQAISFNGSGSTDPDGDQLSYSWNFGDGTTGSGVAPTHTYQASGSYTVALTVSDGRNGTATATTSVIITMPAPPPPPTITAQISPAPNAQEWNNSPVTVSFNCASSSSTIASCTSPVTVSTEGANQVVAGTATDIAGNSVSVSVSLNIDETPPALSITSPTNDTTVSAALLQVAGSASDSLSGLAEVTCNGIPASSSVASFTCNLTLVNGLNLITVTATDVAGNSSSASLAVIFNSTPPTPPTALFITPAEMNVIVNTTRTVRLVDNNGNLVQGATWASSDPSVFQISPSDPPILTAAAPGQAMLTAQFGSLSAQAMVTVFPGPELPAGTMPWVAPPLTQNGFFSDFVQVQGGPTSLGALPDIIATETEFGGATNLSIVRAFTSDGEQLWMHAFGDTTTLFAVQKAPAFSLQNHADVHALRKKFQEALRRLTLGFSPSGKPGPYEALLAKLRSSRIPQATAAATTLSPDTIVTMSGAGNDGSIFLQSNSSFIIKLDGATGNELWRFSLPQGFGLGAPLAIHPDGTLYTLAGGPGLGDGGSLIAVDGGTGQLKFAVPLPASTFSLNNYFPEPDATAGCAPPSSGAQPESTSLIVPVSLSGPIVGLDGMVYAVIPSQTSTTQCVDQNDATVSVSAQVQLLQVKPDGSSVFVPLDSNSFQGIPPGVLGEQPLLFDGGGVVADNENGILASWRETTIAVVPDPTFGFLLQETDQPKVSRIVNGTPTYTSLLPQASVLFDQPVLGSRDPIPPGFFSLLEIAGADDTAYVRRLTGQIPPVPGIQAMDGPSGTLKWLFTAQPSAGGVVLFSAQQDGGAVAEQGNQVVQLDGNGQPTFDNWNVAGPCSSGFCPVNFDDIEPGDQMWFGFRDADLAFGPIVGVPNVTEDVDSTWYRPQANRKRQNAPGPVAPKILFGSELTDITGKTQPVVVGQQIMLTGTYKLPFGGSVQSQFWSVAGTTVGGVQVAPDSSSGRPTKTDFTQTQTTFYWIAPGNPETVAFTLHYKDGAGNPQTATAQATFNVMGPTGVSAQVTPGQWQILPGISEQVLFFGFPIGTPGIKIGARASSPAEGSGTYEWAQVINSDNVVFRLGASALSCTHGTGLDNEFPFAIGLSMEDSPSQGLPSADSEVTTAASFTAYLMWRPGLANDIPVPLGHVTWQIFGDAVQSGGNFTVQSDSSASASTFALSPSYPTWTGKVSNNGPLACQ